MTGVLIRRGETQRQRHTERVPGDGGDRDWSDVSINQGMPRIVGNTRS